MTKPDSIAKLHNIHQAAAQAIRDQDIELVKYIRQLADEILRGEAGVIGDQDLTLEETEMLRSGYVINAIKSVRARKGTFVDGFFFGLKDAKELVERAGNQMGLRVNGQWYAFK